jgi:glycine cleavage system aminomethyltransferase T
VRDRTDDYALIAIQGPRSAAILAPLTSADLAEVRYYAGYPAKVAGRDALLARTGYTGEDGFEIFAAPQDAEYLWAELSEAGAGDGLVPAGLAARDTLRLEAGMPLYGNELTADLTPYDAGLGRVVRLDKPGGFVGRDSLARRAQETPVRQLVGLTLQSRRVRLHGPMGRRAGRRGHQRGAVAHARRADRDGVCPSRGRRGGQRPRRGRNGSAGGRCPRPARAGHTGGNAVLPPPRLRAGPASRYHPKTASPEDSAGETK